MSFLGDLFGSDPGNNSTTAVTNQQVGAQGNQGPVFGAIKTAGGNINAAQLATLASKPTVSTTRSNPHAASGLPQAGQQASKGGVKKAVPLGVPTASSSTAAASSPYFAEGAGSGNVNIHVVSGDIAAAQTSQEVSATALLAQNQLAALSIGAQNDLASKTLDVASTVATAGLGLAGAAQLVSAGLAGTALAGATGGGVVSGSDVAGDVPNQGANDGAASQGGKLDGKTLAIIAALGILMLVAIKD